MIAFLDKPMKSRDARGNDQDQDRWIAELETAERAENFPRGGSLILAESPLHALEIARKMKAQGQRTIVRGPYVRTTAETIKKPR